MGKIKSKTKVFEAKSYLNFKTPAAKATSAALNPPRKLIRKHWEPEDLSNCNTAAAAAAAAVADYVWRATRAVDSN